MDGAKTIVVQIAALRSDAGVDETDNDVVVKL
jgi:hypothetical protein